MFRRYCFHKVRESKTSGTTLTRGELRIDTREYVGCSQQTSYSYFERLFAPNGPFVEKQDYFTNSTYVDFRDSKDVNLTVEELEAKYPKDVNLTIEELEAKYPKDVNLTVEELEAKYPKDVNLTVEELEAKYPKDVNLTVEELEAKYPKDVNLTVEELEAKYPKDGMRKSSKFELR